MYYDAVSRIAARYLISEHFVWLYVIWCSAVEYDTWHCSLILYTVTMLKRVGMYSGILQCPPKYTIDYSIVYYSISPHDIKQSNVLQHIIIHYHLMPYSIKLLKILSRGIVHYTTIQQYTVTRHMIDIEMHYRILSYELYAMHYRMIHHASVK